MHKIIFSSLFFFFLVDNVLADSYNDYKSTFRGYKLTLNDYLIKPPINSKDFSTCALTFTVQAPTIYKKPLDIAIEATPLLGESYNLKNEKDANAWKEEYTRWENKGISYSLIKILSKDGVYYAPMKNQFYSPKAFYKFIQAYLFQVNDEIKTITRNLGSTVAVTKAGLIFSYGNSDGGADCPNDILLSKGVKELVSTNFAVIALLEDGTVIGWGKDLWGADTSNVNPELHNIVKLYATGGSVLALRDDGRVFTWCAPIGYKFSDSEVNSKLPDIKSVIAFNNVMYDYAGIFEITEGMYALITNDDTLFTIEKKGLTSEWYISPEIKNVEYAVSARHLLAVKTKDSEAFVRATLTRDNPYTEGDKVYDEKFTNVKEVISNGIAIAILHKDNTLRIAEFHSFRSHDYLQITKDDSLIEDVERVEATKDGFIIYKTDYSSFTLKSLY